MAFDTDLRFELVRYMMGEISLREFRHWFLPRVWDLTEEGHLRSPLARRVELRLAEFVNGHWTEDDLRVLFMRELPSNTGSVGSQFRPALSGALDAGEPAEPPIAPVTRS